MAKKKIFVSFDFDHDRSYKYLMEAWDASDDIEFSFTDATPREINSNNVSVVKANLTKRINAATYTLVIVGKQADSQHKDHKLIGYTNWINFEVAKSKESGNKLVAIKLEKDNVSPSELLNAGASWAYSFNRDSIVAAINNA